MQPYLEHEALTVDGDCLSQVTDQENEASHIYNTNTLEYLPGTTKSRIQWHLKRPSTMMWRFILMLGDEMLFLMLLLLVLLLAVFFHLKFQAMSSAFGLRDTKLIWIFLALASWSLAVNITHAQDFSCISSLLKSPLCTVCTLILTFILWIVLLYFFEGDNVISFTSPMLFFLVLAIPTFSVWRIILAEVVNLPRFRRQAVIVGTEGSAETIIEELRSARRPNINVLGYISEGLGIQAHQEKVPILGNRSILRHLSRSGMIDIIIMALDYKVNPGLFQEAFEASQLGISVVPMALVYEGISGKIPLDHIGDQWYVALQSERSISPLYLCWRKIMDLTFGVCGTIALFIMFPILALLIKLDSPGPIFFSQERAGYHGQTFRILKFRSMSTDAGKTERAAWVTQSDPRVTRIGRLLRVTHLDELPQVINILRGEMSLIGPRPERPSYVAELANSNLFYSYRLSVKPGLTGWAQVKYGYGVAEEEELLKLQYDLYYIKHQSFLLDILILLKTTVEVVFCHGV